MITKSTEQNKINNSSTEAQKISGHHSWIEINKTALHDNIAFYRMLIGTRKKLGVVVKSNAYGHGLLEISQLLEKNSNTDWLLVAHLHEAIQLRTSGITKSLLVLNPVRNNFELVAHHNITIMVTDHDTLEQLNTVGKTLKAKIAIHLKVDTGLSRFGFTVKEMYPLITKIASKFSYLQIDGIYTHFAESNNSDLHFTHTQQEQFNTLIHELQANGITINYVHTSNTAGVTSLIDDPAINFVRVGAGAYGIWPSEQARTINWLPERYIHLKPVLSWKTTIVHIKTVPADTFVGYNRTFQTSKQTRIAVLPIGYYDGYDKRLSNKGVVHIKGQTSPVIGTIGMNATMIDITHVSSAQIDDEVILLGNHPLVTAADLSNQTGCYNSRQITTQINPSLPRIVI